MTHYLIRKIHHTTGEVFLDATKAKENEEFILVDAESAEEAKERVKNKKPLSYYTSNGSKVTVHELPSEETLKKMFGEDYKKNKK